MKIKAQFDWSGWWDNMPSGRVYHWASFCRAKSKEGIVVYQAILGPFRLIFGKKDQVPVAQPPSQASA